MAKYLGESLHFSFNHDKSLKFWVLQKHLYIWLAYERSNNWTPYVKFIQKNGSFSHLLVKLCEQVGVSWNESYEMFITLKSKWFNQ